MTVGGLAIDVPRAPVSSRLSTSHPAKSLAR